MMSFFRIFIPSWRFFDEAGDVPQLLVYLSPEKSWSPVFVQPEWRPWQLFFNPEGNLFHASNNALERFVHEPENIKSRKVVETLLRHYLVYKLNLSAGTKYKYKVLVREEEVIVSSECIL